VNDMQFRKSGVLMLLSGCLALGVRGQPANSTTVTNRPLALEEAIRLALDHNYNVRIERYNPQIARFNLEASYGYYDPTLKSRAVHDYSTQASPLNFDTGTPVLPGNRTADTVNSDLVGATPWGMQYDLTGNIGYFSNNRSTPTTGPFVSRNYDLLTGIFLTQPVLRNSWTDAGRTQIKVNKKTLQITEFALQQQIMTAILAVQQAYYDLIASRDTVIVQTQAVYLAQRLVAENKQRVQIGSMAPLDEKQAESQAASNEADLIAARQVFSARENSLKNLITDKYGEWYALAIEPTERLVAVPQSYNRQESWENGVTLRPDFNQAKQEAERQGLVVRLQYNQLFPEVNITGGYNRAGIGGFSGSLSDLNDERIPGYSVGVALNVPFINRNARGSYQAAKASRQQLGTRVEQLHQNILVQIDDSIKAAQSSYQRVLATRQARQYAELALLAEQTRLGAGKSTSFQVLQLQRDLTTARSAEVGALADYNKSLAQLYFNEGTTLRRNKVVVEVK
jgi:outer membrane protein